MKRQMDIQRILEDFKGIRIIPAIKSAKKRVLITQIKNEKGESITEKELQMSLEDSIINDIMTMSKMNLNKN